MVNIILVIQDQINKDLQTLIKFFKKRKINYQITSKLDPGLVKNKEERIIVWNYNLIPTQNQYIIKHHQIPRFEGFELELFEEYRFHSILYKRYHISLYPTIVGNTLNINEIKDHLQNIKHNQGLYLARPSFPDQVQDSIIKIDSTNPISFNIKSKDNVIIIQPCLNILKDYRGIIKVFYYQNKFLISFKKKLTDFSDLYSNKGYSKHNAKYFIIRLGLLAITEIKKTYPNLKWDLFEITFFPSNDIYDWSIGQIKYGSYKNLIELTSRSCILNTIFSN